LPLVPHHFPTAPFPFSHWYLPFFPLLSHHIPIFAPLLSHRYSAIAHWCLAIFPMVPHCFPTAIPPYYRWWPTIFPLVPHFCPITALLLLHRCSATAFWSPTIVLKSQYFPSGAPPVPPPPNCKQYFLPSRRIIRSTCTYHIQHSTIWCLLLPLHVWITLHIFLPSVLIPRDRDCPVRTSKLDIHWKRYRNL
jgi:hypothetical protein